MAKNYVRENIPLSRFGVLVAQLESIVASASQQPPDALLCFDLLSDLNSAIDEEPKESILLWQRKCEDALYSLLTLGARRPVRHLASVTMAKIISKGDSISIYSRASGLQGFLSDGKKNEPLKVAGATQCLGELYHYFGKRITSGLLETTIIVTKLMKFNEELVRQEALLMLQKALEGCGGGAAAAAYTEAFRLVTRSGVVDKSFVVRIAAAHCLKAFANIGGPGFGVGELDSLASYCVKGLEDSVSSVRDTFAEALGSLLALGLNPEAQVQPRGKGPFPPAKKLEGGLQRHLTLPFTKASGNRAKDVRVGITLSWVSFLQAIRLKYGHQDSELQDYVVHIMEMLQTQTSLDAHALACVIYILRVGLTDLMTEPTQRGFLVFLGKELESPRSSPAMKIAALRTLSYTLKTLGEVPVEFKEVIDTAIVASVSHPSELVRTEAALALRVVAEVDPTCVGGLISYGVTTLGALRENVSFEKGSNLMAELDSLYGQAAVLAALVSASPSLTLGYPARLPRSVLEVSRKMLTESSRNPIASTVEQEAGWLLLSSLLSSIPKQELEEQVFDILSLWVTLFSGTPEYEIKQIGDLASRIRVWCAAIDALASFIRCFIASNTVNRGVLLQPVIVYLSSALSYALLLQGMEFSHVKPVVDVFIIRTLVAYQSLPDPMTYKSDHPKILQLCTYPYREASKWEESSCLRSLLDKRDAWLGPWIPGRDWFEDELRAFQGGKDGLIPKVWENEPFPQPETINKTLVNQMLLCFGIMFASQDSGGMNSLLKMIDQCLKSGKKQAWYGASITNICVGLLAGLKALITLRPQPLTPDILNLSQSIFQSILAEGDLCSSQRRASSEGLGLLARLGTDIFTARMTRLLLSDLTGVTDSSYAGSIAFALGCIHRNAGGMALSSLVPPTVAAVSSLAKSNIPALQIWSLHGLLLTIEAAGFSYVSHVQATLGLAMDILLSEEIGLIELHQGVGHLINAIVAVLGPELAPGSIFFSRCKAVISEISSRQETATLLESVRFTQQLVLFAPQAVSVHSHVQTLLSTLSSRQPILRHLAVSTLRHLIEKDTDSIIDEEIEETLFCMLDEETDSEIGNMIRATIMRLLLASCPSRPSRWILICRKMVLATSSRRDTESNNDSGSDSRSVPNDGSSLNFGGDDENMVSSGSEQNFEAYKVNREKHLRYRTRVFAAECFSQLPSSVGKNPAHFDLTLAKKQCDNGKSAGDWLVFHVQELISLAYQISTIQFEDMRPIGLCLLSTIVDKFEKTPDPELPGHLLLEQYQAQLVSAVRTALSASSGPLLLEAGLQLATKIMTSGILGGDQAAVKRIFSLISRPLDEFNDLYYPSFAEWVSCKIKIRLLAAHASLKCYTFTFLRRHQGGVPDEYVALLPLFSKSSKTLGKYWTLFLKDYSYVCLCLNLKKNWKPWLDGIQMPTVSSVLQPTLQEAWPVILQALALDAVPVNIDEDNEASRNCLISGYSMVELALEEYQFLWGFALLVLFQQQPALSRQIIPVTNEKISHEGDTPVEEMHSMALKTYEIVLPVFQFLSTERFFIAGFVTSDVCQELLQIFSYFIYMDNSWKGLALSVLSQIVQNCPDDFLEAENFVCLLAELLLASIFDIFRSSQATSSDLSKCEDLISASFIIAKTLVRRLESKMQKQSKSMILALLLIGYKFAGEASTELCFSKLHDFVKFSVPSLKKFVEDCSKQEDSSFHPRVVLDTCLSLIGDLTEDCIKRIHLLENRKSELRKLLQLKLSFSVEQTISLVKLAHEIRCPEGSEGSDITFMTLLKYGTKHVQLLLSDSNMQVRAIGLQVLKTMVQRGGNTGDQDFLIFFSGELIADIFTILQTMLKKPISKESTVVAGECLRFLALLQAISKAEDCRRGLMDLLLKAIVMVFTATENDRSEEGDDIRNTAVKLVSQLAQIPSSASLFKEVLLSMPVNLRQQLQEAIRASVTSDQTSANVRPGMSFEIKLPLPKKSEQPAVTMQPAEERVMDQPFLSAASVHSDHGSAEEDDEDEDDWDTFQSFSASTNVAGTDLKVNETTEESSVAERSFSKTSNGSSDDQESSMSQIIDDERNMNIAEPSDTTESYTISGSPGEKQGMEGSYDLVTGDDVSDSLDSQNQNTVEETSPGQGSEMLEVLDEGTEGADRETQKSSGKNYEQESSGINYLEISPQDHVISPDISSNKDTGSTRFSSGEGFERTMDNPAGAVNRQSVSGKEGSVDVNITGDIEVKTESSDNHDDMLESTGASPKDLQPADEKEGSININVSKEHEERTDVSDDLYSIGTSDISPGSNDGHQKEGKSVESPKS